MFNGLAVAVLVPFASLLFWQRQRLGLFWAAMLFWVSVAVYVGFGVSPATPASLVKLYLGVTTVSMGLYLTSSDTAMEAAWSPLRRVLADPDRKKSRIALLVLLPTLVATQTWRASLPSDAPPPKIRSVHPSPPSTIEFQDPDGADPITVDLVKGTNPHRTLSESEFAEKAAIGRVVYYENCFFCHGDTLAADGHYADAVKPPPANFTDPGTIAMLQESFLFWRIAKGGPGLPGAGTPWDSSMPAWEGFLTEDEIWSVIDFLYGYTGYQPRGSAGGHGEEH